MRISTVIRNAAALVLIAGSALACILQPEPPPPTATPDIASMVRAALDAALGPTASPVPSPTLEPTTIPTVLSTLTPQFAAPVATSTLVPARVEQVVPTQRNSATAVPAQTTPPAATRTKAEYASMFWLPRTGTYTRADGEWKYAKATLVSTNGSLSASKRSSGGQFTLPSKGDLVLSPTSANEEILGVLFMECSEPGDFVSVGVTWLDEIMKTATETVVVGVQFDDEGWQYQLWRPESAPTTFLQVPLNEDHEYVRRLANSRTFSLDLGFDDGSVLRMRWDLPGNLSAPSDAAALCDLMR